MRHPQTVIFLGTGAVLFASDAGTSAMYAVDSVADGPWSTQVEAVGETPGVIDSMLITAEHGIGMGLGLLGVLATTAAMLKYRLNRRK